MKVLHLAAVKRVMNFRFMYLLSINYESKFKSYSLDLCAMPEGRYDLRYNLVAFAKTLLDVVLIKRLPFALGLLDKSFFGQRRLK